MLIKTNLKPRDYKIDEVVRIRNIKQQQLYMDNDVFPIDIYPSYDDKTDNKITIMVFERDKTKELYQKWKNYELEYKTDE